MDERAPEGLPARIARSGLEGVGRVVRSSGVDREIERAIAQAITEALSSEAIAEALEDALSSDLVERAIKAAVESPAVERAIEDALESEMADRIWERLLASDKAQALVERVANAPEVRAAITQQGFGLIDDLGRQIRRITLRLDLGIEGFIRRLLRRGEVSLETSEPTHTQAGFITRSLAFLIDIGAINGLFFLLSGVTALALSLLGTETQALFAFGVGALSVTGVIYFLLLWSLTGQTLGMRFLSIRIIRETGDDPEHHGLGLQVAARRLVLLVVGVVGLLLGPLSSLSDSRRRGWHDRVSKTEVITEPIRGYLPARANGRD